eukprot:TRINITY_DN1383_c0_g4_i2.p2 TRINITY_DN1383_c0_g4~~TRINITY_DN1383_c0_g4_i2.p2  ORF type:complete len:174 (+),score=10.03 TRINITY_DN1383_c0_g4_i2:140-661(+)
MGHSTFPDSDENLQTLFYRFHPDTVTSARRPAVPGRLRRPPGLRELANGRPLQRGHCPTPGAGASGGGLVLWVAWIIGTWLGVYFGGLLQNPKSLGLDMVLGCFLLAMALGGNKSPRTLVAWTVAATSSLAAWKWLPPNTHVVVGALAGGAIGFFWMEKKSEAPESVEEGRSS